ncbi:hypothetical protein LCGC14_1193380 [marine sediment metagenome]|uniref:Uncharacterized protein n=1 Tax=marine sediment metagenome TaxID=412755 RepID=A0A0F9LNE7_9ZZZZ
MKRQTIDGHPIYSDVTWYKMLKVGDTLLKFGYQEASQKPNLFFKKIYGDNKKYELLFADLRGNSITPIWKELRLSLYPSFNWEKGYSCNNIDFGFQIILLRRHISIPIVEDIFYFDRGREPDGYCINCNKDLLKGRDLLQSQDSEGLESDIELYFCDKCKIEEYNKIRVAKLCVHCKERDWVLRHHITYEPELIIKVCYKCHKGEGGIHWWGFPNLLWKQRKTEIEESKRKRRQHHDLSKPVNRFRCGKCGLEIFSIKKSYKCSACNTRMRFIEVEKTNFHCVKCSSTWSGVYYQDNCIECNFDCFDKLTELQKIILKMNIQSNADRDERIKYEKLFRKSIILENYYCYSKGIENP